jgi:cell division protease FtsH
VANKNVTQLFARGDSIEGQLKKEAPVPGQPDRTYQQFTTERPTFATDDLLAELTAGGASVRATPIVQQRGFLTNLLISFAPILLLVGFYVWMSGDSKARWLEGSWAVAGRSASIRKRFESPSTTSPASTRWKQRSMRLLTS